MPNQMLKLSLKVETNGKNSGDLEISNFINNKIVKLNQRNIKAVSKLGQEALVYIKETINNSKVRPQAGEPTELENAIRLEKVVEETECYIGIGKIEDLNKEAKGWRAINYGSSHLVGKQLPDGVFDPSEPKPNKAFFRQGRWKKGQKYNEESYMPIIKNPILPMNYIEKSRNWLQGKFQELITKIKNKDNFNLG